MMNTDMQDSLDEYLVMFENAKARTGSPEAAVAVVDQLGRDRRTAMLSANRSFGRDRRPSNGGNNDRPASPRQLETLRELAREGRARFPSGPLTVSEASKLIGLATGQP